MTSPDEGWHGWSSEEQALFIAPLEDDNIGLFLQIQRSTELCAVFVDPAMAQMVMQWLDAALTATGAANSELLERLQNEQPLLFAQSLAVKPPPEGEEEDDEDEEDG